MAGASTCSASNTTTSKKLVLAGEDDEKVLAWCLANGRKPTGEDIEVWSGFMMKRGWRDDASERVAFRLKESGIEHLDPESCHHVRLH